MEIPPGADVEIPPAGNTRSIYQLLPDWQQEVWRKLQGIEARAEAVESLLRVPKASLGAALAAHEHIGGWAGGPGECGAECSCGVVFDGFDTHAEAMALLEHHLAANGDDDPDWTIRTPEPVVFLCGLSARLGA